MLSAYFQRETENPPHDPLLAAFEKARLDLVERLARASQGLAVSRYVDVDTEYLDVEFPAESLPENTHLLLAFANALDHAGLALPRFQVDSEDERWLLEHLFGERVPFAEVRGGGFASSRPIRRELRALSSETSEAVTDATLVERILKERGVGLDSRGPDRKIRPAGDPGCDGATFLVDLTEDEALDAVEEEAHLEGLGYFDLEISP